MMPRILLAILIASLATACNQHIDANGNAYQSMVASAAIQEGVPVHIAQAVIRHESNYNPRVRGRAGEWGIGQIKCATARGEGFEGPCSALRDAGINLTFSMKYLRKALDKGGHGCRGVSLYQRGVGARPQCTSYGRAVQRRME